MFLPIKMGEEPGVAACKRADSMYKKKTALNRWLDSDDAPTWNH